MQASLQRQSQAMPEAERECGYVVGFINGVANEWNDALLGLKDIEERVIGKETRWGPIEYELWYNYTEGLIRDVRETFVQLANVLDESGELARYFEFLWELLPGPGSKWFWALLIEQLPSMRDGREMITVEMIKAIREHVGQPQLLAQTVSEIRESIYQFEEKGHLVLVVAHSQGNLYASAAVPADLDARGNVRVAHVAPPLQRRGAARRLRPCRHRHCHQPVDGSTIQSRPRLLWDLGRLAWTWVPRDLSRSRLQRHAAAY